jgi:hypothetical protein
MAFTPFGLLRMLLSDNLPKTEMFPAVPIHLTRSKAV